MGTVNNERNQNRQPPEEKPEHGIVAAIAVRAVLEPGKENNATGNQSSSKRISTAIDEAGLVLASGRYPRS